MNDIIFKKKHSKVLCKNGRKMGDWSEQEIVSRKRDTPCQNGRVYTYYMVIIYLFLVTIKLDLQDALK